jgi:16S rRNA C1402 (ribose-2'-O) methylase RsmI
VEGAEEKEYSNAELTELLQIELSKGKSKKDAIKKVQELTGVSKNKIYNLALELKEN